jgi:hypothetical protein
MLLALTVFVVFYNACKHDPCPTPQDHDFYFSSSNAVIPYKNTDTIRLIDSTGDLLQFVLDSTKTGFLCYSAGGNGDCMPDDNCYQFTKYNYRELNNKRMLSIDHYLKQTSHSVPGFYVNFDVHQVALSDDLVSNSNSIFLYKNRTFGQKTYQYAHFSYNDKNDSIFYNTVTGIISIKTQSYQYYIP